MSTVKFSEGVDVSINLGVDAKKSDQQVRGATTLPAGTGKDVRVAVFTSGANADAAKEAGADFVGMEDLAEQIKGGMMDFDVVVASPDAMRVVGQLGQVLGPRGLCLTLRRALLHLMLLMLLIMLRLVRCVTVLIRTVLSMVVLVR